MYPGERFNSISHLVGTALAITGAVVLIVSAALGGDPWRIVSFSIFGAMLVALYGTSTLYHAIRHPRAKSVLRRLDHATIFLLIAGTYTPFTLVTLRGALGWMMFALIWLMAAWGIWRVLRAPEGRDPPPWLHLAMGWLGVAAIVPLVQRLGAHGSFWLVLGGVLYSAGVLFYLNDRRWRHAHGVWHLFVMGGSAAHVITVLFFVA
jgi:hemolysin III